MIGLAVRLLRGGGRSEIVRVALVVAVGALATGFLLSAVLVTAVSGCDGRDCDRYTSPLLNEPGLRPGVATALALLAIPVLILLGSTVRIEAARRDRRAAALRLAGASPGQVRLLAVIDVGAASAVGSVLAFLTFLIVKAEIEAGTAGARTLPTDVPMPPGRTIAVLLAVPLVCCAVAGLALRGVVTTPLGVARRASHGPPGAWPLLVIALGLVIVAASVRGLSRSGESIGLLFGGASLIMLGLVASTAWLAVAQARLVARRTGWAPALLAARRIQADPRAQARALSAVLLATFFAAGSSVLRAEAGVVSRDDPFFTAAYNLVDLALLVALVVSGAGLVVSTAEQISERRRSLATLTATGVPRSVLQRSAVVQALLPAVPMVLLAAALGAWSARILLHEHSAPLPLARLSGIVGIALLVVLLSCLCTLPALRRAAAPGELRWT